MFRIRQHPFFDADGDGKGGTAGDGPNANGNDGKPNGDANPGAQGDAKGGEVTFTAEQQAAINKLIGDARKEGRDAAKRDADEAKRKADEDAETNRKVEAGKFDEVRTDLEGKVTTLTGERDTLASKVERYETAIQPVVASLKESVGKDGTEWLDGFPQDAEPLDQMTWLNERAAFKAKVAPATQGANRSGIPPTPKPNGTGVDDEAGRKAQQRMTINAF